MGAWGLCNAKNKAVSWTALDSPEKSQVGVLEPESPTVKLTGKEPTQISVGMPVVRTQKELDYLDDTKSKIAARIRNFTMADPDHIPMI